MSAMDVEAEAEGAVEVVDESNVVAEMLSCSAEKELGAFSLATTW
jgi:hypothetical protein